MISEIPPLKLFPSSTGLQQLEETKCLLIAAYANLPIQVCEKNELKGAKNLIQLDTPKIIQQVITRFLLLFGSASFGLPCFVRSK